MQSPKTIRVLPVAVLVLLLCAGSMVAWSKVPAERLRAARVALAACLVLLPVSAAMLLTGCGSSAAPSTLTTPGTYTLTVTATTGSQTMTTKLTLIVQ
jgi:hypothetical protein